MNANTIPCSLNLLPTLLTASEEGGLSDLQVEHFLRHIDQFRTSPTELEQALRSARHLEDCKVGEWLADSDLCMTQNGYITVVLDFSNYKARPSNIQCNAGDVILFRVLDPRYTPSKAYYLEVIEDVSRRQVWTTSTITSLSQTTSSPRASQTASNGPVSAKSSLNKVSGARPGPGSEFVVPSAGNFLFRSEVFPFMEGQINAGPALPPLDVPPEFDIALPTVSLGIKAAVVSAPLVSSNAEGPTRPSDKPAVFESVFSASKFLTMVDREQDDGPANRNNGHNKELASSPVPPQLEQQQQQGSLQDQLQLLAESQGTLGSGSISGADGHVSPPRSSAQPEPSLQFSQLRAVQEVVFGTGLLRLETQLQGTPEEISISASPDPSLVPRCPQPMSQITADGPVPPPANSTPSPGEVASPADADVATSTSPDICSASSSTSQLDDETAEGGCAAAACSVSDDAKLLQLRSEGRFSDAVALLSVGAMTSVQQEKSMMERRLAREAQSSSAHLSAAESAVKPTAGDATSTSVATGSTEEAAACTTLTQPVGGENALSADTAPLAAARKMTASVNSLTSIDTQTMSTPLASRPTPGLKQGGSTKWAGPYWPAAVPAGTPLVAGIDTEAAVAADFTDPELTASGTHGAQAVAAAGNAADSSSSESVAAAVPAPGLSDGLTASVQKTADFSRGGKVRTANTVVVVEPKPWETEGAVAAASRLAAAAVLKSAGNSPVDKRRRPGLDSDKLASDVASICIHIPAPAASQTRLPRQSPQKNSPQKASTAAAVERARLAERSISPTTAAWNEATMSSSPVVVVVTRKVSATPALSHDLLHPDKTRHPLSLGISIGLSEPLGPSPSSRSAGSGGGGKMAEAAAEVCALLSRPQQPRSLASAAASQRLKHSSSAGSIMPALLSEVDSPLFPVGFLQTGASYASSESTHNSRTSRPRQSFLALTQQSAAAAGATDGYDRTRGGETGPLGFRGVNQEGRSVSRTLLSSPSSAAAGDESSFTCHEGGCLDEGFEGYQQLLSDEDEPEKAVAGDLPTGVHLGFNSASRTGGGLGSRDEGVACLRPGGRPFKSWHTTAHPDQGPVVWLNPNSGVLDPPDEAPHTYHSIPTHETPAPEAQPLGSERGTLAQAKHLVLPLPPSSNLTLHTAAASRNSNPALAPCSPECKFRCSRCGHAYRHDFNAQRCLHCKHKRPTGPSAAKTAKQTRTGGGRSATAAATAGGGAYTPGPLPDLVLREELRTYWSALSVKQQDAIMCLLVLSQEKQAVATKALCELEDAGADQHVNPLLSMMFMARRSSETKPASGTLKPNSWLSTPSDLDWALRPIPTTTPPLLKPTITNTTGDSSKNSPQGYSPMHSPLVAQRAAAAAADKAAAADATAAAASLSSKAGPADKAAAASTSAQQLAESADQRSPSVGPHRAARGTTAWEKVMEALEAASESVALCQFEPFLSETKPKAVPHKKSEEGLVTAKLPALVAREAHAFISVNMAGRIPLSRPFNGLTSGLSEQISSELAPLVENALVEAMYKAKAEASEQAQAELRAEDEKATSLAATASGKKKNKAAKKLDRLSKDTPLSPSLSATQAADEAEAAGSLSTTSPASPAGSFGVGDTEPASQLLPLEPVSPKKLQPSPKKLMSFPEELPTGRDAGADLSLSLGNDAVNTAVTTIAAEQTPLPHERSLAVKKPVSELVATPACQAPSMERYEVAARDSPQPVRAGSEAPVHSSSTPLPVKVSPPAAASTAPAGASAHSTMAAARIPHAQPPVSEHADASFRKGPQMTKGSPVGSASGTPPQGANVSVGAGPASALQRRTSELGGARPSTVGAQHVSGNDTAHQQHHPQQQKHLLPPQQPHAQLERQGSGPQQQQQASRGTQQQQQQQHPQQHSQQASHRQQRPTSASTTQPVVQRVVASLVTPQQEDTLPYSQQQQQQQQPPRGSRHAQPPTTQTPSSSKSIPPPAPLSTSSHFAPVVKILTPRSAAAASAARASPFSADTAPPLSQHAAESRLQQPKQQQQASNPPSHTRPAATAPTAVQAAGTSATGQQHSAPSRTSLAPSQPSHFPALAHASNKKITAWPPSVGPPGLEIADEWPAPSAAMPHGSKHAAAATRNLPVPPQASAPPPASHTQQAPVLRNNPYINTAAGSLSASVTATPTSAPSASAILNSALLSGPTSKPAAPTSTPHGGVKGGVSNAHAARLASAANSTGPAVPVTATAKPLSSVRIPPTGSTAHSPVCVPVGVSSLSVATSPAIPPAAHPLGTAAVAAVADPHPSPATGVVGSITIGTVVLGASPPSEAKITLDVSKAAPPMSGAAGLATPSTELPCMSGLATPFNPLPVAVRGRVNQGPTPAAEPVQERQAATARGITLSQETAVQQSTGQPSTGATTPPTAAVAIADTTPPHSHAPTRTADPGKSTHQAVPPVVQQPQQEVHVPTVALHEEATGPLVSGPLTVTVGLPMGPPSGGVPHRGSSSSGSQVSLGIGQAPPGLSYVHTPPGWNHGGTGQPVLGQQPQPPSHSSSPHKGRHQPHQPFAASQQQQYNLQQQQGQLHMYPAQQRHMQQQQMYTQMQQQQAQQQAYMQQQQYQAWLPTHTPQQQQQGGGPPQGYDSQMRPPMNSPYTLGSPYLHQHYQQQQQQHYQQVAMPPQQPHLQYLQHLQHQQHEQLQHEQSTGIMNPLPPPHPHPQARYSPQAPHVNSDTSEHASQAPPAHLHQGQGHPPVPANRLDDPRQHGPGSSSHDYHWPQLPRQQQQGSNIGGVGGPPSHPPPTTASAPTLPLHAYAENASVPQSFVPSVASHVGNNGQSNIRGPNANGNAPSRSFSPAQPPVFAVPVPSPGPQPLVFKPALHSLPDTSTPHPAPDAQTLADPSTRPNPTHPNVMTHQVSAPVIVLDPVVSHHDPTKPQYGHMLNGIFFPMPVPVGVSEATTNLPLHVMQLIMAQQQSPGSYQFQALQPYMVPHQHTYPPTHTTHHHRQQQQRMQQPQQMQQQQASLQEAAAAAHQVPAAAVIISQTTPLGLTIPAVGNHTLHGTEEVAVYQVSQGSFVNDPQQSVGSDPMLGGQSPSSAEVAPSHQSHTNLPSTKSSQSTGPQAAAAAAAAAAKAVNTLGNSAHVSSTAKDVSDSDVSKSDPSLAHLQEAQQIETAPAHLQTTAASTAPTPASSSVGPVPGATAAATAGAAVLVRASLALLASPKVPQAEVPIVRIPESGSNLLGSSRVHPMPAALTPNTTDVAPASTNPSADLPPAQQQLQHSLPPLQLQHTSLHHHPHQQQRLNMITRRSSSGSGAVGPGGEGVYVTSPSFGSLRPSASPVTALPSLTTAACPTAAAAASAAACMAHKPLRYSQRNAVESGTADYFEQEPSVVALPAEVIASRGSVGSVVAAVVVPEASSLHSEQHNQEVQSKALGTILSNAFSKFVCESGGHDNNGIGLRKTKHHDTLVQEQQHQQGRMSDSGQDSCSHPAESIEPSREALIPSGHHFSSQTLARSSSEDDGDQPTPAAVPIARRSSGGFDPVAAANELERRYRENLLLAEEQENAAVALAADDLSSLD